MAEDCENKSNRVVEMSKDCSERPHDNRKMSKLTSDLNDLSLSSFDSGVCSISTNSELSMPCQSLQSMDLRSREQSLGYYSRSIESCQDQCTTLNIAGTTAEHSVNQRQDVPVEEVAPSPDMYYELLAQDEDGDT